MTNNLKCPKCSAEMEEGFLIESKIPLRWIGGKPDTNILGATRGHGDHRPIETYRCVGCGYLESYARTVIS